jgi:hypothetical protein
METVGAVLMIGHFVVSIFQVQLGNPIIYSLPFKTMEQCEVYKNYMPQQPIKMDLEWNHITKTQCFTQEQFKAMMDKQRQQQQPEPNKPGQE